MAGKVNEKGMGGVFFVVGATSMLLAIALAHYFLRHTPSADAASRFGQLGDFVGGLINPLVGALTVVGLGYGFRLQMESLHQAREQQAVAEGAAVSQAMETERVHAMSLRQSRNTLFAAKLAALQAMAQVAQTEIQMRREKGRNWRDQRGRDMAVWEDVLENALTDIEFTLTELRAIEQAEQAEQAKGL